MNIYFEYDAHKKYSIFALFDERGNVGVYVRVENTRSLFRCYLKMILARIEIAVETVDNWCCMMDKGEQTDLKPLLTNAGKAKTMMEQISKTDKLASRGLVLLLQNGTLFSIWIPLRGYKKQALKGTNPGPFAPGGFRKHIDM